MEKLVVVIMGQNCEKFIGMCLNSVKDADAIVYCDGGSVDNTFDILGKFGFTSTYTKFIKYKWEENDVTIERKDNWNVIINKYNQEDKGMNGKQRNFYLDYVKNKYPDWWCLAIDADEVVEDLNKFKEFIQTAKPFVYSPRIRHLIGDLGHEDTTQMRHWVLNRFFKISEADRYPEQEHPILIAKNQKDGFGREELVIWHLAYVPNMWEFKKRYENHMKKSQIHSKEFLRGWYFNHLFGVYPKERFNVGELPEAILNEFGTNKDEVYFIGRKGMEIKHYQDAIHWKEFFNPKNCVIYGCGAGQRVYTMNKLGVDTVGLEINKYAVNQRLDERVKQGDITKDVYPADLVVAFDVLEHLKYEDLDKAIDNMVKSANKHILVSIPVLGNPALDLDATHIIKETEKWWMVKFLSKGLKQIGTPNHFLYKEQVYIFEKGGENGKS